MEASGQDSYPIVAVVGALGTQGASVIAALSSSPSTANWRIRALTSSPDSVAAKDLRTKPNVSVVRCDINDFASISDAFRHCTHIFANTAFHGPTLLSEGPEATQKLEHAQAMNLVRAAAATVGLRHLVFSTLPDPDVISGGKWKIPHFSSKQGANAFIVGGYPGAQVDGTAKEEIWGALRHKSSLMSVGMYGSNLLWDPYRPRKRDGTSDKYVIRLPCPADAPFAVAGDEKTNVGLVVRAIFEQPERTLGTWVSCESEKLSCRQWVEALGSAAQAQGLDGSVEFEECSMQPFEDKWGVVGAECGLMFQYIAAEQERSFLNTSGLPEVTVKDLGLDTGLISARELYHNTDCGALFRSAEDGTPRFGTIGVKD